MIGYWLVSEYEGKGIMTRACEVLIDYGFDELGLNRIVIRASTDNVRSQAVPLRLGFTREGVARQAEWLNDRFIDMVVYSMLRSEWHSGT
jgi:ribosomal-protein-serine acetyltransferase